ncbi:acid sphingomyelinase-like phosphodiesterase 3a [Octopus vulgaris]|uniref:Acid sphingomyelinase-like phosphodiesterase 3a n=1 Tax=Octopus vulgaris TaxID=6645 RepID=A0AA36EXB4_OCTVU|nr:acid sphingomyelinase-like phosphodiesterase 3a [Octopus vulgaris]
MNENLVLNKSKNLEIIKNCTDILKEHFPQIPLASSLGNHDLFPDAQCPIATDVPNLYFKKLAEEWLTADLIETFSKNGYYFMATKDPDLYIVNLNTLLYYNRNKLIKPNQNPDPNGQFTWLQNVLEKVRKEKKKVFVIGHIPPGLLRSGKTWLYKEYNEKLTKILQNYSDVIIAGFFGHEHEDSFKVIHRPTKDLRNNNGVPIFVAPALTPWVYDYNRNPAVRLVRYNVTSKQLLQITQYYVNLPKANEKGQVLLELEYVMPKSYDLDDLSAAALLKLRNRMQTDDKLFKQYLQNIFRSVEFYPQIDEMLVSYHLDLQASFLHSLFIAEVNKVIQHIRRKRLKRRVFSMEGLLMEGLFSLDEVDHVAFSVIETEIDIAGTAKCKYLYELILLASAPIQVEGLEEFPIFDLIRLKTQESLICEYPIPRNIVDRDITL